MVLGERRRGNGEAGGDNGDVNLTLLGVKGCNTDASSNGSLRFILGGALSFSFSGCGEGVAGTWVPTAVDSSLYCSSLLGDSRGWLTGEITATRGLGCGRNIKSGTWFSCEGGENTRLWGVFASGDRMEIDAGWRDSIGLGTGVPGLDSVRWAPLIM